MCVKMRKGRAIKLSDDSIRELEQVGVNTTAALTRLVRNKKMYKRILNNFLFDTNFKDLETSILKKEYDKAMFSAHTLKGISGNLGMEPLFSELDEMVKKIYNNNLGEIDSVFSQISVVYHSIYNVIEEIQYK